MTARRDTMPTGHYLTFTGGARVLDLDEWLTLTGMPDAHRDCTCAKEPTP